jgi:hypothetical protein
MRASLILSATLAACATAAIVPTRATGEIAISMRRDTESDRPTLLIKVTNDSPYQICIRRDAIQNPYSYEMDLEMRDAKGRAIRYNESGYIEEPLEGDVQVKPGTTAEGKHYLHPRFKLRNQGRPFPQGMSIRASLSYRRCDSLDQLVATSAWQPI